MASKKIPLGLAAVFVVHPANPHNDEIGKIKEDVREMMDYTKDCNSADECAKFVRSVRYQYIFIITSSDFINDIFDQNIYQIRHVQAIFLFDPDKRANALEISILRESSYKVNTHI